MTTVGGFSAARAVQRVLRGQAVDADRAVLDGLPPVQFLDPGDTVCAKQVRVLQWNEEAGLCRTLRERLEGGEVEMIEVVVGDEDEVDGRQVFEGDSRWDESSRTRESHWAGARGPDGVGEDAQPIDFDEQGGVSHPGDGCGARDRMLLGHGAPVGGLRSGTLCAAQGTPDPPEQEGELDREASMRERSAPILETLGVISRSGTQLSRIDSG